VGVLVTACGDDADSSSNGGSADSTGTVPTSTSPSTATESGETVGGTMSGGASTSADASSGSASMSATASSGSGTSTNGATGDATGAESTTGEGGSESSGTTGSGIDCSDVGRQPFDYSYLWVSNSPEGTVSKIDTQLAVEVARYTSGPAGAQDPSRTSVSADGRFAVVVNRSGGISMIAAEEDDCVDADGSGTLSTSTGAADVLAWGTDECVLWNVPLPASGTSGPRPVSWTIGEQDPITCEYAIGNVWVGWYDAGANQGSFRLLDGETGATLEDVAVPEWSGETWGPYGGAIDSENNFWAIGWGTNGPLIRIDGETNAATHFGSAGGWIYGMGLDLDGNPWATGCGNGLVYRFDAEAETWATIADVQSGCLRGMQVDSNGVAWIAKNSPCGLASIDTTTEPPTVIDPNIALPGCNTPVGVSIDAEGFVWIVDQGSNQAMKFDPTTGLIDSTVEGLVSPYTYSDMTGAGIATQILPS
jgi:hypothetical protein